MPFKGILLSFFSLFISFPLMGQMADSIYTNAERMPYFPGCKAYIIGSTDRRKCSNQSVKAYIFNHIIYPQEAKKANIEGAVYVRFVVDKNGEVKNPKILRDIGGGCGAAALKMLASMPKWEPAYHRGRKVNVALELPIHFYFKENTTESSLAYTIIWGNLKDYKITRKNLRKNLSTSITIFDTTGKTVPISELRFLSAKNNKLLQKSSNGKITSQMQKLVRKVKKGSLFSVIATVQKDGQFIEVVKEFSIDR